MNAVAQLENPEPSPVMQELLERPRRRKLSPVLDGDLSQVKQRSELENARRFIGRHGDKLRYVPAWGKWIIWAGTHWAIDDGCRIETLARDTVEEVWQGVFAQILNVDRAGESAMLGFARSTASANGIQHFLHLARSEPGIAIDVTDLDRDEWLLNVKNGTIDLRTGERRPHNKADMITKVAPVVHDDQVESDVWKTFVSEIMSDNADLIAFLRRLCGYFLTGSIREQILPIFHGVGANGKSVLIGTLEALLGTDYGMHAPPDLLMVKRHESHPTERADLFGKRLVSCVETEAGRQLAESLVKELTGGDRIRARRMKEDFWEFAPTHKLIVACNHRPIVRGADNGIWRRLRLVPFEVVIPPERQDKDLPEKLKRELTGVLTWCIQGCLEWQRTGLAEPADVLTATDTYRDEQDVLGDFFEARCIIEQNAKVSAGLLYEAYRQWARDTGHEPDNGTVFGRKLTERGFPSRKVAAGKVREGIGLLCVPGSGF